MNKIKRVSLFFRIIFQISFLVLPILFIVAWMHAPESLRLGDAHNGFGISFIPFDLPIVNPLPATIKLLGFTIGLLPLSVNLYVLYCLIKLFRLYEKGEIFSIINVQSMRNLGYALLVGQLISPIYQGLISAVLTWSNPPHLGLRIAIISFNQTNLGILFTALLIILISWVMAEGCKLREEQQLTI